MIEGLTEGRMVHFVLPDGEHRPAIVVKVWDKTGELGTSNLTVFPDWSNDSHHGAPPNQGLFWATSILYSADPKPNTWHFIERA